MIAAELLTFLSSHGNGNISVLVSKFGANLSQLYIITSSAVLERFWEKSFWKKKQHIKNMKAET